METVQTEHALLNLNQKCNKISLKSQSNQNLSAWQNLYQVSTENLARETGTEQNPPLGTWEIRPLSLLPGSQKLPGLEASPKGKHPRRTETFSSQRDKAMAQLTLLRAILGKGHETRYPSDRED